VQQNRKQLKKKKKAAAKKQKDIEPLPTLRSAFEKTIPPAAVPEVERPNRVPNSALPSDVTELKSTELTHFPTHPDAARAVSVMRKYGLCKDNIWRTVFRCQRPNCRFIHSEHKPTSKTELSILIAKRFEDLYVTSQNEMYARSDAEFVQKRAAEDRLSLITALSSQAT
jgi:hypothetical protein